MARQPEHAIRELALAGASRELEVALEHLRHAVHAPVAERAAAGEDRQSALGGDAAVLDEGVRFADAAVPEGLEPEVDEGREAVVELGQIDVGDRQPGVPFEPGASSNPASMMSSSGQCDGRRGMLGLPCA